MTEPQDPRQSGDRIEGLLDEIHALTSPPAWERVEELVRSLLELYGMGLARIMDIVAEEGASADDLRARLVADELVASLLVLHDLHPETLADGEVDGVAAVEATRTTEAAPVWLPLRGVPAPGAGEITATVVSDTPIVLSRVGGRLHAYRDRCPSCGVAVAGGRLEGNVLRCPSCHHPYDVGLAGRSLESHLLHLDPVPLLEEDDVVRVALPVTPAS